MATELQKQVKALEEAIDSFPIGAVAGRQHSLEDKIAKTVTAITLTNSRLLLLKARDAERGRSLEDEVVDLSDLPKVLDEYEKGISKIVLCRSVWKTCFEATALSKLTMNDNLSDSQMELLLQITHLHSDLRSLLTEHKRIILQIEVKKEELQQKLHDYKKLLTAQELEQEEQATGVQRQHIKLKKRLLKKLEKLNIMRILMSNLLTLSEVSYLKRAKWKDCLLQKQQQITLEMLDAM